MSFAEVQSTHEAMRLALLNDCIYLHPLSSEHRPECRTGDIARVHYWIRGPEPKSPAHVHTCRCGVCWDENVNAP